jgi:hypothetical protein
MKTYPIRFRPDMQEAIDKGLKSQTRRTNLKWLKAEAGDRLRIIKPTTATRYLMVTADARQEPVQSITEGDCIEEGCPPEYLLGRNWFRPLWDEINGDDPEKCWAANPDVAVLSFRRETP